MPSEALSLHKETFRDAIYVGLKARCVSTMGAMS